MAIFDQNLRIPFNIVVGMGGFMADDIVYEMPFGLQGDRVQGKENLIQLLEQFIGKENGMYSTWDIFNIRVYAAREGEVEQEIVFAEMDSRGIVKQNGYKYTQSYISLLHIIDGWITLWREYFNPIHLQNALDSLNTGGKTAATELGAEVRVVRAAEAAIASNPMCNLH
ncbi:nuclear transport factor 2 family protein [Paenibacillus oleatilyticus]|uniref:nuclear transport factor 2 family protein n=1 Tax=Paenibacillus oleatilyticus TaxID=2594886 RepID=UPI001C1F2B15|nr:hypothetical protein [Paenibacillus oleatilyticus]MBU7316603.1 hypothetical protein [Paenibacillus oleatilyticus]